MIAIYARQSVERPDSISIAMQVEHCRRICPRSVPQQVYTDRGFSGTNTRRPALQQMLEAVEQGQIESVYVYKLDRISRSLCDFAAMMQEFRRRGVTLHSVRESFDTQTEIGGMLLNLLRMFAELEQKTIAGRVRDNYYARAVQQLALGGVPPYGYTAKPVTHGGHPTTMLEVQPEEAQQVQAFYTGYGVAGQNVEQLVQAANQAGSRTRQGARWSNSAVLRLLRSPVYVQGDLSCAVFLQRQGAVLTHALEAYCCGNGYLVYGSPSRRQGSKLVHLEGEHVAAGLHRGIIDGTLWRSVQERLNARGGSTNRGTGHTSWLQGLAVCGLCGTRCYARSNGKGAAYTYFVCRGKRQGICTGIAGLRNRRRQCCPMHRRQSRNPLPRRWLWKSWNSECGGWRLNWGNRMRRRYFCGRNSSGWGQSTSGWNRNCVRTPLNRRYSPQKIGKHGGQMPAWNSVGMPLDCSCGKYDCFQRTGKYICNKGSTAQSLCGAA